MNNFKLALDCGEILVFQNTENDDYLAVGGAGKDKNGNYRESDFSDIIEECYQGIGYDSGCKLEDLENFKYISSKPHAFGDIVPVGTKVRILDNAEEECEKYGIGYMNVMKEMIGKVCEINKIMNGNHSIWDENKTDDWYFPRTAFAIAQEEEAEKSVDDVLAQLSDNDKEIIKKSLK